jgi:2-deoxy-D-gluconate 3-dehydrogenase
MNNIFNLNGRTAIVTGGTTGLGQAMAIGLAETGADIVIADIMESTETKERILSIGRKAIQLKVNLLNFESIDIVAKSAIDEFGKVDILINNAGIIRRTPAIDFPEKDWDDVMNINSKTVFFLSQAVAKDMLKRKYGKIINIASLLSFSGGITVPSYSASKGAVAQITKALANEWAQYGININAIAPGYMVTNNTAALRKDEKRFNAISERIPSGRWGMPEDLKGAAIFLASPASDYVNGHVLVIDGGWMAR